MRLRVLHPPVNLGFHPIERHHRVRDHRIAHDPAVLRAFVAAAVQSAEIRPRRLLLPSLRRSRPFTIPRRQSSRSRPRPPLPTVHRRPEPSRAAPRAPSPVHRTMTAVAPTSRAVASSIVSSSPSDAAPVVRARGRRGKLTPADLPPPARARAPRPRLSASTLPRARDFRPSTATSPRRRRASPARVRSRSSRARSTTNNLHRRHRARRA